MERIRVPGSASSAGALMSDGIKPRDEPIQGTHYQTATLEALNRIGDTLEKLLPLAERITVALEGPEDEQSLPEEWGWGETEDETTDEPPDNYDPLTNRETGDTRPYLD